MLSHLRKGDEFRSQRIARMNANLALDLIGLSAQLFYLPVVVPPFDRHLLVLTLQPFDRLLAREALVLNVSLGTLEFFLCV